MRRETKYQAEQAHRLLTEFEQEDARVFLKKIESERFKSYDDPGIHGIKLRLKRLPFVTEVFPPCCSGHPVLTKGLETSSVMGETGYIHITYKISDPRSANFHNKLRLVIAENHDRSIVVKIRGTHPLFETGRIEDKKLIKDFTTLTKENSPSQKNGQTLHVSYNIQVISWDWNDKTNSAYEVAEKIANFRQKVSDL